MLKAKLRRYARFGSLEERPVDISNTPAPGATSSDIAESELRAWLTEVLEHSIQSVSECDERMQHTPSWSAKYKSFQALRDAASAEIPVYQKALGYLDEGRIADAVRLLSP